VEAVLDVVLGWLADPSTLDRDRFNETFLARVPDEELVAALENLSVGRWEATDIESRNSNELTATLTDPASEVVMRLHLGLDTDGRIAGLGFGPAELSDPPLTLAALTDDLVASAPNAGFLRAEVGGDDECTPIAFLNAEEPLPLGSVFKLYVLGAVAAAIAAGELDWNQQIEVRDELDSLPSGITQDEPAGSALSVHELALRMIEISDNTATDHLIDLVGRDAVEHALVDLRHGDSALNLPFLTTREIFVIKADPDLLARYTAADEVQRRELLADEVASAPSMSVEDSWVEPRGVTTVEWFGSPADICRALVSLDALADVAGLEPIAEVLSANPGPMDLAVSQLFFKGGNEPGVLFAAWLATRPDGSRVAVTGGAADETTDIAPQVILLLQRGLTLNE
jgi:beta-lactamase class A